MTTCWIGAVNDSDLVLPAEVLHRLNWADGDVVRVSVISGECGKEIKITRCKCIDSGELEMWFDVYLENVAAGEIYVIQHEGQKILLMPANYLPG